MPEPTQRSAFTNLDRPPLREAALRRALIVPGALWTDLTVVAETGSTNADVAAKARLGAAERQTAGRGRLDRSWQSPPRAGLALSVLLRPDVPPSRLGWLPLLAGVALAETVRRVSNVDAYLKWPNDLLLPGDRKCAGILAELIQDAAVVRGTDTAGRSTDAAGRSTDAAAQDADTTVPGVGAVVLGIGLNTTLTEDELPRPDATSLRLAGAAVYDRDTLVRQLLRSLEAGYTAWVEKKGDPDASGLRESYVFHCGTIGRRVRVELPDHTILEGVAAGVDTDGRLLVTPADGRPRPVAAGDVIHVR
jgi:BirA family biotin operon repressor/biotin-[acetyl-CoA-carboxylase] ligase